MLYRRFDWIHVRLLYYKHELRVLEKSLRELDKRVARSEDGALCLQCREQNEGREEIAGRESRKALLKRIEKKAMQYDVCLTQLFFFSIIHCIFIIVLNYFNADRNRVTKGQLLLQAQQLVAMNKAPMCD